ncbi:hypothetical protein, partial [Halomonas sp. 3D7M]|uniref:hypothetical protein n=1 Tax=Halomonas sp. 3D7M TaxID=2742617 RepID=UPI001D00A6F3
YYEKSRLGLIDKLDLFTYVRRFICLRLYLRLFLTPFGSFMAKLIAGYTSPGITKIHALASFLPEYSHFSRIRPLSPKPNVVIGWGVKP